MRYPPEGMLFETAENCKMISSIDGIEAAYMRGKILEARAVRCDKDCNLYIALGDSIVMIPRSEAIYDARHQKDVAILSRVGRPVCFKVLAAPGAEGELLRYVLSRREAQEEAMGYYMTGLEIGDILWARITKLEHFGAFVDIGRGISSFVGIENISVSRIRHAELRFHLGQLIPVVVTGIDPDRRRVSLSHKELLGTWAENAALFHPGDAVEGIVRGIEPYGIFVELTPNLSGLAEYREDLHEEQRICVYIKSIIPEKMKVKLAIVDTLPDCPLRSALRYFVSGRHIDHWSYEPEAYIKYMSEKLV